MTCGEQHLAEERARREEQQLQYQQLGALDGGADELLEGRNPWTAGSVVNQFSLSSLSSPLLAAGRPPLGARLYVRSATRRALPVVVEELAHWMPATRLQSARLLRLLLLFHEHHVLPHLAALLPAIVRGLQADEGEEDGAKGDDDSADVRALLLDCAALLGALIASTIIDEEEQGSEAGGGPETFRQVARGLLQALEEGQSQGVSRRSALQAVRSALRLG